MNRQTVSWLLVRFPGLVAAGLLVSAGAPVRAGEGWFVELGAGHGKQSFEPLYHYVDGGTPDQFKNDDAGFAGSLRLGHQQRLADRFGLGLSAEFIYQGANWTLTLPDEPADFDYEIPYTFSLSLQPDWELTPDWRVFAELGLAYGQVRERKQSPRTSQYDAEEWLTGLVLGAGVSYRLSDQTDLSLSYRQIRYEDLQYRSYWMDGTHAETIEDSPRADLTLLSLRYRF
jgi:opacity protein-like surface antigen